MKKYNIYILLLSLFFAGCEEEIDWPVDSSEIRLVVESKVTTEYKQHYVFLTSTQPYFNQSDPEPVSGATIFLRNDQTFYSYTEVDGWEGLYVSDEFFEGTIGNSYGLTINLKNPIYGHSEYTASSTIPPPFQIDSLECYIYDEPSDGLFNFESRFYFIVHGDEDTLSNNYYLLKVYKNGRLLTDRIEDAQVWDDIWFNGLQEIQTDDFGFFEKVSDGDTLTLEISGIEKPYYDYIKHIKEEGSSKDPFGFMGSPSNIYGNFNNGALGYFVGSSISKKSVIINY